MTELLTIKQLAKALACSERTIRRGVAANEIPHRLVRSCPRFLLEEVLAALPGSTAEEVIGARPDAESASGPPRVTPKVRVVAQPAPRVSAGSGYDGASFRRRVGARRNEHEAGDD